MAKMKWVLILLVLVAGICLLASTLRLSGSQKSSSDLSNWKIYENKTVGFSLLYPPEAIIDGSFEKSIHVVMKEGVFSVDYLDSSSSPIEKRISADVMAKTIATHQEAKGDAISKTRVEIDGITATRLDYIDQAASPDLKKVTNILLQKKGGDGKVIWIGIASAESSRIFDQILNSFKLLSR